LHQDVNPKERDNLSDAKIEAEEYLEQERLIRKKKNVLYQTCIQESRTNAEEIKSKHEALRERLQHEQEKLRNHSQTLHELEKRHSRSVGMF
jgi:chromosome segregation ATPase